MEVEEEQRVEQVQISERKRTVALAVDGSAHSEHAFQFYWAHIHKDGDFLVLIHCPEMYDLTDASPAMADRLVKEKKTQISSVEKKYMQLLKEKGAHLNGSFRTGQGKPGEAICRIADEEKAAVIVCGTRGLGTIRRTIMGSVSDYIVHHSHVPVLVCRHKHDKHDKH